MTDNLQPRQTQFRNRVSCNGWTPSLIGWLWNVDQHSTHTRLQVYTRPLDLVTHKIKRPGVNKLWHLHEFVCSHFGQLLDVAHTVCSRTTLSCSAMSWLV